MTGSLDVQSEKFQATGSMPAKGQRNQLGRPAMDPLVLLVREAAQNSWDARLPDVRKIRFGIEIRKLGPNQLRTLRDHVFRRRPNKLPWQILDSEDLLTISIYDRGTTGLGGPTRADSIDSGDAPRDFVDFLRNVGQPPDKERGCGTYGYGKAAFYMVSRLRAICVHTHARRWKDIDGRRFMVAALGEQDVIDSGPQKGRYTGRHWWGVRGADEVVDPLTGDAADALAHALGLPGFADAETGTTITILAPDPGSWESGRSRSITEAASVIGETMLWYLWPKMIDTSDCLMECELIVDGEEFDLPEPERFPPLGGFVDAMRALKAYSATGRETEGIRIEEIEHGTFNHRLGLLALNKDPLRPRRSLFPRVEESIRPVPDRSHHVALLRTPELVVKYMEGKDLPSEVVEYTGVFRADDGRDRSFAESEPPAHEDWVVDSVEDRKMKSNVRVALRKIKEAMRELVRPATGVNADGQSGPLGAFATSLGGLLPTTGTGGGESPIIDGSGGSGGNGGSGGGRGSGGRKRSSASVRFLGEPRCEEVDGKPVIRFRFEVHHAEESSGSTVRAEPFVALDEGGVVERDPPSRAVSPEILWWEDETGERTLRAGSVEISGDGPWNVVVSAPGDVVVGIDLQAEALKGETP